VSQRDRTMTIGTLSHRTGVAVKTLRSYEDGGLIYTVAAAPGTTDSSTKRPCGASP
jgi:hypothetical protein